MFTTLFEKHTRAGQIDVPVMFSLSRVSRSHEETTSQTLQVPATLLASAHCMAVVQSEARFELVKQAFEDKRVLIRSLDLFSSKVLTWSLEIPVTKQVSTLSVSVGIRDCGPCC